MYPGAVIFVSRFIVLEVSGYWKATLLANGAHPAPRTREKTMLPKTFLVCTLLAGLLALSASARESTDATMKELKSKHLFTITIQLHPTLEMGDTPAGKRRIFSVSGGEFAGDRIRGTIMPLIGSDLLLVRADGSAQQDV